MPELPEVESVRRLMRRAMQGKQIVEVFAAPDPIVLSGEVPETIQSSLTGRTVHDVGRKGKYWWLELDCRPWMFGHLGMSGWIRQVGAGSMRLLSHGDAPLEDEGGSPRFLKLMLTMDDGAKIAFTDGRRLGRIWLADGPDSDVRVKRLGFDALDELPSGGELYNTLQKRRVSIKGVLLDQAVFAGVGNWIADEVLYQARIAPGRLANTLKRSEAAKLRLALSNVIAKSVEVDADYTRYPTDWLFVSRWGGKKGQSEINGHRIVRETIAGRTTAWIPTIQK